MATLEDLEKRVSKLEKGDDDLPKVPLFGKVFATVGNRFSDLVLRTKGDIKIQWGNKYIPLIKDGKLAVENKFIYNTDKVGKKDGIYVTNDNQVTLVSKSTQINLAGGSSNTIPKGTIVMFSGDTIPEGWTLCNGDSKDYDIVVPNLIDRFIIGANESDLNTEGIIGIQNDSETAISYYKLYYIIKVIE